VTPPRTSRETQATINRWIDATFGAAGSNLSCAVRANEEMAELLRALDRDDADPEAAEEIADIVIILYRLAERFGVDLHEQVDRKMAKNRGRGWRLTGHGHGYHTSEAVP
jgi:NTP pyrophosphatase (non-canonical NTP hydrolase)